MTTKRKERKSLGYTTQTTFVDRDDGKGGMTGGTERMRFPVYDQPDYCEAFRRFRMEQRITPGGRKRLGMAPSELSAIEGGQLEASRQEMETFKQNLLSGGSLQ